MDIVFIMLLGHAALLAILAVAVADMRHYKRKFESERDLSQRLLGHLSRIQSQRSANVLPFARKTNGQQRT